MGTLQHDVVRKTVPRPRALAGPQIAPNHLNRVVSATVQAARGIRSGSCFSEAGLNVNTLLLQLDQGLNQRVWTLAAH